MLVRPSLVLQIMLKPEDYGEQAIEELKRSYIYLAQSIVKEQPADAAEEGNVMRLSIRLMRPYWDASDPKSQELWEGVMPQWLRNVTRNVSTAMHNYNTVLHPAGAGNVVYDWVDFEFDDNITVRVKVDADNRIPSEMSLVAERVRALANEGAFGDGRVALIRVPSKASWEAQLAAAIQEQELKAQQEAAAQAAQGEDGDGAIAVEAGAAQAARGEDDEESIALQAGAANVIVGESGSEPSSDDATVCPDGEMAQSQTREGDAADEVGGDAAGEAGDDAGCAEDPASQETALPAFDVDLRIWGIEYEDGTVVEFDSAEA